MKTTTKHFTAYGNPGLVQVRIEPETAFRFRPVDPEIKKGGLLISESTGEGIVGKLIALNSTDSFLLLTDADVLAEISRKRIQGSRIVHNCRE